MAEPPISGDPSVSRTAGQEAAEKVRLTFRRFSGLDRSGPPPAATLRGQPLHPWTIPNAIGFVRLCLLPLFLWLAFRTGSGRSTGAAVVFAVIAWSDYLDGIAARVTGQYSRLGTLMDPVIDRLLIFSGAAVCWYYELLPRWALVLLALRELSMLVIARWGLRHGLDVSINWLGRWGVWPVFSAVFFAIAGALTLAEWCLYVGLALVIAATIKYVVDGRAELAARPSSSA